MGTGTRHLIQPLLADWFTSQFDGPTEVQMRAWPEVAAGHCVLISAPTGTGKTLAAWLPLLDWLLRTPRERGVRLLYITPLRALSRDMVANLSRPLDALETQGLVDLPGIGLRTGDTPAAERRRMRSHPPEILVTTPESLFVMLASVGGRNLLQSVETVLVDEIHALADNKRGAHLALSLEWLADVVGRPLQRIGISATQRPLESMAALLCGRHTNCRVIAVQSRHAPEIRLELPQRPLGAYADLAHWAEIYQRLTALSGQHHSMLVFCNTRALVERVARALAERIGDDRVAAHHGSLGQQRRAEVERGLKQGRLRVVVSSSSLELGLDIGSVDVVCQLGSPGRINLLRQRAGRSRHQPGQIPRVHLFPLNLAELLEGQALIDAITAGELDHSTLCTAAVDVLCQHVVAMVAQGPQSVDALYRRIIRAAPWHALTRGAFEQVLDMLCEGFVAGREQARALIRRSARHDTLLPGADAGRSVVMNAGTIPEMFEYQVIDVHDQRVLGSLDEEFSFDSSPGQIIQLGNQILRICRIGVDTVWVEAVEDETPGMPFWLGDGPGRSDQLSSRVQMRLDRVCGRVPQDTVNQADGFASGHESQLQNHLQESRQRLGTLPGVRHIVMERFFDPGGDQHLVIHAPLGSRINRAWGLALRKRFCRKFNFELQAAATEDAVLISLGATHSFALSDVAGYLHSSTVRDVLTQALLDTPLFQTRFRWCATIALAIRRVDRRGRVSAQIQRNQTENLIARVFPDQLACLENLSGAREIPEHPLVLQALHDCLEVYLDADGLQRVLKGMECGQVEVISVDTTEPSLLARAIIAAPRHSYLDPANAEERRTRAFETQPSPLPSVAVNHHLQSLRRSAWLTASDRQQFESSLMQAGYITAREGETGVSVTGAIAPSNWLRPFQALVHERAAVSFRPDRQRCLWCSVDALPELIAVWPQGTIAPVMPVGLIPAARVDRDESLMRLMLKRVRVLGAVSVATLARETGLPGGDIEKAIRGLEQEGLLMEVEDECWAHRDRLAVQTRWAGP